MMNTYDRLNPFSSRIVDRYLLTKDGSTKKTYHLALSLDGSQISYQPGDSLAILPQNDPDDVDFFLKGVRCTGEEEIFDHRSKNTFSLRSYLLCKANLHRANHSFLRMLHERSSSPDLAELLLRENKPKLVEFLDNETPADLLNTFSKVLVSPQEIPSLLLPLLPRFYSIASSQRLFPNEVHLTVAAVSYTTNKGVQRHGVGTHFLCERALLEKTVVPLYIQPSHGFALPADSNASIILVGPGTGIAPYRAFLQERLSRKAPGRNWLFFGERNRSSDFYYEEFWLELQQQKRLHLDLAFSRDGAEKLYVQHNMWKQRKALWAWIEEGAYFYVCGDAKEMAKDVEATLQKIAASEGGLSDEDARRKIKEMRAEKRYLADVY